MTLEILGITADNEIATEEWRPVVGYEGYYEVSSFGRVKSLKRVVPGRPGVPRPVRERILARVLNDSGYPIVTLRKDGKRSLHRVHRLVLVAFVGPAPEGLQGCHNDGDSTNNHLTNLRWDSVSANAKDRIRHGTHNWMEAWAR